MQWRDDTEVAGAFAGLRRRESRAVKFQHRFDAAVGELDGLPWVVQALVAPNIALSVFGEAGASFAASRQMMRLIRHFSDTANVPVYVRNALTIAGQQVPGQDGGRFGESRTTPNAKAEMELVQGASPAVQQRGAARLATESVAVLSFVAERMRLDDSSTFDVPQLLQDHAKHGVQPASAAEAHLLSTFESAVADLQFLQPLLPHSAMDLAGAQLSLAP